MSSARISSDLWYHFHRDSGQPKKATCRYCSASLSLTGSTGNLSRHLKTKHPTVSLRRTSDADSVSGPARSRSPSVGSTSSATSEAEGLSTPQSPDALSPGATSSSSTFVFPSPAASPSSSPSVSTSRGGMSQSSMSKFVDVVKPVSITKKRQVDVQLLKMVCKEYHPFSLVEDNEFRKFTRLLCPGYDLPSRKTLSNSLLPSLCVEIEEKLKTLLNNVLAVSVTTDGWTSPNNTSFYALTAHYLDETTKMRSNLLECSEFSDRHTSDNIASWIDSVCKKWDIKNKIAAVVTDNAANITAAVRKLNWRHIPCYAHTLNLLVDKAIHSSIHDVVKVKGTVQYFKQSSHALAKLHEVQKSMDKPNLKLKQDVPTRWNSTFDMLDRFLKNKEPLISTLALLEVEEAYKFSSQEWDIIKYSVEMLSVFNDVTIEISAEQNVSLSKTCILSRIMTRRVKLGLEEKNLPSAVRKLGDFLVDGLSKRFENRENNELVAQSMLLDPRFKKPAFVDGQKYRMCYQTVASKLRSVPAPVNESSNEQEAASHASKTSSLWGEWDTTVSQLTAAHDPTTAAIVELDKYINEPLLPRSSDPLVWWNDRKLIYPKLYNLVLRRLCIPATSVPCERVFSKTGQILTDRRSRLTSAKLSKIIFVNCNAELL